MPLVLVLKVLAYRLQSYGMGSRFVSLMQIIALFFWVAVETKKQKIHIARELILGCF